MVRQLRPPNLQLVHLQEEQQQESGSESGIEHATDLLKDWDINVGFDLVRGKGVLIGKKIGDKIPGYRTFAAFLTTLRQNLHLSSSLLAPPSPTITASPMSTPPTNPTTSHPLPPPSPLSTSTVLTPPTTTTSSSTSSNDPLASLPPLTTYPATTDPEKTSALKLIADAQAQNRQRASYAIIHHPLSIAVTLALLAILYQLLYTSPSSLLLISTTAFGLFSALLLGVRMLAAPYLEIAESINYTWLGESEVLVTRYGDDVIGALVFEVRREGRKRKRGVVRGWSVRKRERGKGVGKALLEEGVRAMVERGCDGVGWEEDGVYAKRVLPGVFNGLFERRQKSAQKLLKEVVDAELGTGRKK